MGDKLLRRCNKPVVLQLLLLPLALLLLQLPMIGVVFVAARLGNAGEVLPLQSPPCRAFAEIVEPLAKSDIAGSYH